VVDPLAGLVLYAVFLFSVTAHEAAHAFAALLGGDLTAYEGGQVSLDPIPHLRREPWGMAMLPLLSVAVMGWPFGYASTPYDPVWAERHPRRAAWMALAGPAANLTIALLAALVLRLGLDAGGFRAPQTIGFLRLVESDGGDTLRGIAMLVSALFSMNLVLFALNLIPVPPLDGSSAITLLFGEDLARRWRGFVAQPMLAMAGILVAWKLMDIVLRPLFRFAVDWLY
jgi:Zn-dependent protease